MSPWQELLWAIPNSISWWDAAVGILAGATAIASFVTMILHQSFSALLVGRAIVAVGLAMGAFIPINSGAEKLAFAMLVIGLAWSNFLIATNWCNREHPMRDLIGELARLFGKAVDAVAPRDRHGPADAVALHKDAQTGKGD